MKKDWIYCNDRLPKVEDHFSLGDGSGGWRESKNVLIGFIDPDGYKEIGIGQYILQDNGKSYWYGVASDYELSKCNVVAWMPIPKLPDPPLREETCTNN